MQALAAYVESNSGVETVLTVTGGAQQLVAAGTTLTWFANVTIEITMVVTSSSGANTGMVQGGSFNA